jgi:hypothetical protein
MLPTIPGECASATRAFEGKRSRGARVRDMIPHPPVDYGYYSLHQRLASLHAPVFCCLRSQLQSVILEDGSCQEGESTARRTCCLTNPQVHSPVFPGTFGTQFLSAHRRRLRTLLTAVAALPRIVAADCNLRLPLSRTSPQVNAAPRTSVSAT